MEHPEELFIIKLFIAINIFVIVDVRVLVFIILHLIKINYVKEVATCWRKSAIILLVNQISTKSRNVDFINFT